MKAQSQCSAPCYINLSQVSHLHWHLPGRGVVYAGVQVAGYVALASEVWCVGVKMRIGPEHEAMGVPDWVCGGQGP